MPTINRASKIPNAPAQEVRRAWNPGPSSTIEKALGSIEAKLAILERVEDATPATTQTLEVKVKLKKTTASEDSPFPEEHTGPTDTGNGLFRLHFFNGRMLTADALSREQVYWDTRARVVARAFPAGVAWGLGVSLDTKRILTLDAAVASGDSIIPTTTRVTLEPGLAFDEVGRPIAVGTRFSFTLSDLLAAWQAAPLVIAATGSDFGPCLCVARTEAQTAGALMPKGPYLLVIRATESPEGSARVMGTRCEEGSTTWCTHDGWRSQFVVSLAQAPWEVVPDDITVWELQSSLSSWYFAQGHPAGGRFASEIPATVGTRARDAVPLALLWINEDGGVVLVDPWIPRRPIIETGPSRGAAFARGMPDEALMLARWQQFQAQLAASLVASPNVVTGTNPSQPSLIARHFMDLPPWGFLPVAPVAPPAISTAPLDIAASALDQAEAWFAGSNAVVWRTVALQADGLQATIDATRPLDPIKLRAAPNPVPVLSTADQDTLHAVQALKGWDDRLIAAGATLADVVAGNVALVKLTALLRVGTGGGIEAADTVLFSRVVIGSTEAPPRPLLQYTPLDTRALESEDLTVTEDADTATNPTRAGRVRALKEALASLKDTLTTIGVGSTEATVLNPTLTPSAEQLAARIGAIQRWFNADLLPRLGERTLGEILGALSPPSLANYPMKHLIRGEQGLLDRMDPDETPDPIVDAINELLSSRYIRTLGVGPTTGSWNGAGSVSAQIAAVYKDRYSLVQSLSNKKTSFTSSSTPKVSTGGGLLAPKGFSTTSAVLIDPLAGAFKLTDSSPMERLFGADWSAALTTRFKALVAAEETVRSIRSSLIEAVRITPELTFIQPEIRLNRPNLGFTTKIK